MRDVLLKIAPYVGYIGKILNLPDKEPIFIVGTGRCGTSILSKILRTHPDITVFLSEANDLWHPNLYPDEKNQIKSPPIEIDPKTFTQISIESWPDNHSKTIKEAFNGFHLMTGKKKVFIVKSAMISFMMPKILTIYPNAKFIHIYRFAPSVIESYFKKNFGKYKNYKYTEEEYYLACAKYWNDCILNLEQDKKTLSLTEKGAYFEFSYEDLCEDPEGLLQNLSTYLDLKYDKFNYDLSTIKNTNYKVKDIHKDKKLNELINHEIYPAMKLKGYIS